MPRLFSGVELPEAIREQLSSLERPLPGTRWIDEDDLHITLRFFGDVDRSVEHEIIHALSGIERHVFEVRLSGLSSLGGNDPRAIVADVEAGPELARLAEANERAARAAGLAPEKRKFRPHVTIARLRNGDDRATARYLSHHGAFRSSPFLVSRFVLFSSKPRVGGGPYVVEQAFPLIGGSWDDDEDDGYLGHAGRNVS